MPDDLEMGNVVPASAPVAPLRRWVTASKELDNVDMELGRLFSDDTAASAPKPSRSPFKLWESYDIEHQGSKQGMKKVLHVHHVEKH